MPLAGGPSPAGASLGSPVPSQTVMRVGRGLLAHPSSRRAQKGCGRVGPRRRVSVWRKPQELHRAGRRASSRSHRPATASLTCPAGRSTSFVASWPVCAGGRTRCRRGSRGCRPTSTSSRVGSVRRPWRCAGCSGSWWRTTRSRTTPTSAACSTRPATSRSGTAGGTGASGSHVGPGLTASDLTRASRRAASTKAPSRSRLTFGERCRSGRRGRATASGSARTASGSSNVRSRAQARVATTQRPGGSSRRGALFLVRRR